MTSIRYSLSAVLLAAALVTACNKHEEPAATAPVVTEPAPAALPPAEPVPPPAPVEAAPAPKPEPVPKPKPKPKPRPAPEPTASAPAPQACYDCGTVTGITPVSQKGDAGAIGTIGGAAAGGVIGHQFGGGKGRDVATIGGAILGAMAGREVEKRARSTTVYDISVRMEDGSTRTVTVNEPGGLSVGSAVRVDGNNLRPR